jgi:hypothetical protein
VLAIVGKKYQCRGEIDDEKMTIVMTIMGYGPGCLLHDAFRIK